MHFSTLAATAFATTALASPQWGGPHWGGPGGNWGPHENHQCISQQQATDLVNTAITVFNHLPTQDGANATAQALLTDDFGEYSDSIKSLQGLNLTGTGQTATKQEWIQGIVYRGPPTTGIQSLYVSPAGCNKVVWYFEFDAVARATYRVRGFNLIGVVQKAGKWQIDELDLEFNSIAWGLDDGEIAAACGIAQAMGELSGATGPPA
ncbi:hypothetical protein LTR78_010749 [Recurvomyces mirabilis]|uniref:NTF2-like domain-containing protein n=1 Tax=Recurvomyces mirabilis TaxID=574656 RepID=A0AAE0WEY3_9PEZI|nr:hypothetical protein LTR78_010749 [Recurvomyces mirabilis]KAK5155586.1 hypothetical protein LTS14_005847 [Recurvomyces mirabilis]